MFSKVKTEVKETKLEFKTLFVDSLMIGKATEMYEIGQKAQEKGNQRG